MSKMDQDLLLELVTIGIVGILGVCCFVAILFHACKNSPDDTYVILEDNIN